MTGRAGVEEDDKFNAWNKFSSVTFINFNENHSEFEVSMLKETHDYGIT